MILCADHDRHHNNRRSWCGRLQGWEGAIHFAELQSKMLADDNSHACLTAGTCLPLGSHSVLAFWPPLQPHSDSEGTGAHRFALGHIDLGQSCAHSAEMYAHMQQRSIPRRSESAQLVSVGAMHDITVPRVTTGHLPITVVIAQMDSSSMFHETSVVGCPGYPTSTFPHFDMVGRFIKALQTFKYGSCMRRGLELPKRQEHFKS
jgi:hypothetical protein